MISEPDWKAALRERFEMVLADLADSQEPILDEEETENVPDIYTFYEALASLRHEVRQGNRKTAEAFSQFGDSLGAFDLELKRWSEDGAHRGKSATSADAQDSARALRLPLVEMADRIYRLRSSFQNPPSEKASWFGKRLVETWQQAWREREQAVRLLEDQVTALLASAGLSPIPVQGKPFDPTLMTAVARDEEPGQGGALVVVEEITRGYLYQNNVVRLAEVRVARQQPLN